jgi:D-3-phosphoglycerate dehydrogenase
VTDIAILDSDLREIDRKAFDNGIDTYDVERIAVDFGDISAPIPADVDLSSYRAIYVRVGNITADVLRRASNVEIVSTCGSGYDHIDVEAATSEGVMVTHTPEAPAVGVVEHVFGLLFSLIHKFPEMFDHTANGEWTEGQVTDGELRGKQLGVVGLGTVGTKVATIAQEQFGANVIAYDPYVTGERSSPIYPRVTGEEIQDRGITLTDRETLFESADIVTLHVPLTDATQGLVGNKELAALEGGYLLNTSRGGVVDEKALIESVDRLAGVGLDVMETEPPEPSNPLLSAPNVHITPHIAGGTEGYATRSAEINAERIQRALDGDRPEKLVNPDVLD